MNIYKLIYYKFSSNRYWVIIAFIIFLMNIEFASFLNTVGITLILLVSLYPTTAYLSNKLLVKALNNRNLKLFIIQFLLFSLLSAISYGIAMRLIEYLVDNKIINITHPELLLKTSLLNELSSYFLNGVLVNILFCSLRFFEENLKFQKTLIEAQLQTLKAQLTPHFMFNVLNHLHYFIKTKDDAADSLLLKYSDMLRFQLYIGKERFVPIEEEMLFLKNFVDIETMRWQDKLNIECTWRIENKEKEIAPLLLITLIENAFKHVSRDTHTKGYINVLFEQSKDWLTLKVENSKSILPHTKKEHSGLGIKNLLAQLDILYHAKYVLSINDSESVYTIELKINL